jgi:hypothetical protein
MRYPVFETWMRYPVARLCDRCQGAGVLLNCIYPSLGWGHSGYFDDHRVVLNGKYIRLAEEIAQLESLCNHGVITEHDFGDEVRALLRAPIPVSTHREMFPGYEVIRNIMLLRSWRAQHRTPLLYPE